MANIWQQLIGEEDAPHAIVERAAARLTVDTHPSEVSCMIDRRADASEIIARKADEAGRDCYRDDRGIRPTLPTTRSSSTTPRQPVLHPDSGTGRLERAASRLRGRGVEAAEPSRRPKRADASYAAVVATPTPADAWRWHGIALMKQGRPAQARAASHRYLTMKPDAPDAAWVRQTIG